MGSTPSTLTTKKGRKKRRKGGLEGGREEKRKKRKERGEKRKNPFRAHAKCNFVGLKTSLVEGYSNCLQATQTLNFKI